jgi:L,D-transpeptidase catalytic domain/Putative peptidoglycan binding domain
LKRRVQIGVVFLVAILVLAAVGAYAWDSTRNDQIADGITIGSVDVGGMTAAEAKDEVESSLVDPLRGPVTVHFEGVKYKLSADKLDISSDVDGMVDQALDESREGGVPGRVWRYATGGRVDVAISPQITYSNKAIDEFVAKVTGVVDRDPVDASISPTTTSLNTVPAKDGISVDEGKLRARIERAVQSPKQREVALPVHRVEPEVTQDQLASKYPTYITVDLSSFTARLWVDLKLAKSYTVAVGQPAYPTPTGLYSIESMQVDPVWSVPNSPWAGELAGSTVAGGTAENPLKARWMGITAGAGFHGTDDVGSLGTAASHGCLRMSVPDVIDLYDRVDVGTPVYIG